MITFRNPLASNSITIQTMFLLGNTVLSIRTYSLCMYVCMYVSIWSLGKPQPGGNVASDVEDERMTGFQHCRLQRYPPPPQLTSLLCQHLVFNTLSFFLPFLVLSRNIFRDNTRNDFTRYTVSSFSTSATRLLSQCQKKSWFNFIFILCCNGCIPWLDKAS